MQWEMGYIELGIKQPGHEADQSLITTGDLKKGEATPPLSYTPPWRGA
jgi:hypothetical protein